MAESQMCDGGCIFVNEATGLICVALQVNLSAHEALVVIEELELTRQGNGAAPQARHSDNGSQLTLQGLATKLRNFAQIIAFAGMGMRHHHSGAASMQLGPSRAWCVPRCLAWQLIGQMQQV